MWLYPNFKRENEKIVYMIYSEEDLKECLKSNLKLDWSYAGGKLYLTLCFKGEIIDQLEFGRD